LLQTRAEAEANVREGSRQSLGHRGNSPNPIPNCTFVVAAGFFTRIGRRARRNDEDRPQIIVDADYTERFTANNVARNIGHGMAKNITLEFSAPRESTSGSDITELAYFRHGTNFMAPHTNIAAVWEPYQYVVQNLKDKDLTEGIMIASKYEDRQGKSYETEWTINPLLFERSGYSEYKGYKNEVQALENQARVLEMIAEDIRQAIKRRQEDGSESTETARQQGAKG
jgi:hypothetical protein